MADDLAALGAGALFGLGAQAVSDLVHGQVSGLKDYAASAVGGAVAAEAALYSGGLASGAAGGAAYSATKQLLEKGSIDAAALAKDTALGAVGGKAGQLAGKALGSGANALARTAGSGAAGAASGAATQVAANVVQGKDALEGVGEAALVGGITGAAAAQVPGAKSAKEIKSENTQAAESAPDVSQYGRVKLSKGTRAEIWDRSKAPDGKVYDPSGVEIKAGEPWQAGHRPEHKFSDAQTRAAKQGWETDMWKSYQRDPDIYRPEKARTNASHEYEDD
ncbi:MAG: HNH/ENDO VII family nuclease [Verrucomicrobiae bacterium]|nr:HNH/ENDO VII family nuclease [Verrucomicrobiae bacterium]